MLRNPKMNRLVLVAVLLLGLPGAAMAQSIMDVGTSGSGASQIVIGNATSGTVTIQPVTGALGSVTASLPANTGNVAELNLAQSWTAAQTFGAVLGTSNPQSGTTYTIASTDCGKTLLFTGTSPVVTIAASVAPAAGTTCNMVIIQGGSTKVSVNGTAVSAASLVSSHSYTGTNGTIGSTIGIILTTLSSTATAYLTGDGS